MNKFQNEGTVDRIIRIVLGLVFLLLAMFSFVGAVQIIFYIIGAVALITGIVGFCGLYKILGINTCSK